MYLNVLTTQVYLFRVDTVVHSERMAPSIRPHPMVGIVKRIVLNRCNVFFSENMKHALKVEESSINYDLLIRYRIMRHILLVLCSIGIVPKSCSTNPRDLVLMKQILLENSVEYTHGTENTEQYNKSSYKYSFFRPVLVYWLRCHSTSPSLLSNVPALISNSLMLILGPTSASSTDW